MKIKEHIVTVRDVYEGYYDHPVNGVWIVNTSSDSFYKEQVVLNSTGVL